MILQLFLIFFWMSNCLQASSDSASQGAIDGVESGRLSPNSLAFQEHFKQVLNNIVLADQEARNPKSSQYLYSALAREKLTTQAQKRECFRKYFIGLVQNVLPFATMNGIEDQEECLLRIVAKRDVVTQFLPVVAQVRNEADKQAVIIQAVRQYKFLNECMKSNKK